MHPHPTIPQKANNPTGLQNPSAWARNDLGMSFASFGQAKEDESYMPVGRHYGFIYNEYNNIRAIAYEVGHGVNALHHTFSAESETFHATNGTSDNLMDYNGGTTLNHLQWQWSHESHTNLLGFLDDEREGEGRQKATPLYFVINGEKYKYDDTFEGKTIGAYFATLLTEQEITIEVRKENSDEYKDVDLSKLEWFYNKKEYPAIKNDATKVHLKLDKETIGTKESALKVVCGDFYAELKIVPYSPIITFERPDNYDGEFLFDDGFNIDESKLYNKDNFLFNYKKIQVGFDDHDYYSPVVGLKKGQYCLLKMLINKDVVKVAQKDRFLKIEICTSIDDVVKLNEAKRHIITKNNIDVVSSLTLYAEDTHNSSLVIKAIIPSCNNKTVGQIEYNCKKDVQATVNLVFVKFGDESSCPKIKREELVEYLRNNSLNQLSVDLTVKCIDFSCSLKKADFDVSKKAETLRKICSQYSTENGTLLSGEDVFFITNLKNETVIGDMSSYVGGYHYPSKRGGILLKSPIPPTETVAHELGHWLGLSHPFESKDSMRVVKSQGDTYHGANDRKVKDGNFMDYLPQGQKRRTWFMMQQENISIPQD